MKRNNKSWIRQLSESYIRQTLNESDFHQAIDDRHARFAPEDKGRIKQILDAHVAQHGPFADEEEAAEHIVANHSYLTPMTGESRTLTDIGWKKALLDGKLSTFPSNDSGNDGYQG